MPVPPYREPQYSRPGSAAPLADALGGGMDDMLEYFKDREKEKANQEELARKRAIEIRAERARLENEKKAAERAKKESDFSLRASREFEPTPTPVQTGSELDLGFASTGFSSEEEAARSRLAEGLDDYTTYQKRIDDIRKRREGPIAETTKHQRAMELQRLKGESVIKAASARARATQQIKKTDMKPLTDAESKKLTDIRSAAFTIRRIQRAAQNLSQMKRGPISGFLSGKNPYDADVTQLENLINQVVPGMARGVFNEVGVLTDSDVERYRKMLPNIRTNPKVGEIIINELIDKIQSAWFLSLDTYEKNNRNIGRFDPLLTFEELSGVPGVKDRENNRGYTSPSGPTPPPSRRGGTVQLDDGTQVEISVEEEPQ
jgi:hypothetical protein